MNEKERKNYEAFLITGSAFVGAFASRWIDKAFDYNFPLDIIILLLSVVILFSIVRYIFLR